MDSDYTISLGVEPANLEPAFSADGTLVHIVAAVGVGVCVVGVGWVWACLVGMAAQVPWSALLQVLACMSVVLHYFPLKS